MTLFNNFSTSQIAACVRRIILKAGLCMQECVIDLISIPAMFFKKNISGNSSFYPGVKNTTLPSNTIIFDGFIIQLKSLCSIAFKQYQASDSEPDLIQGIYYSSPSFTRY